MKTIKVNTDDDKTILMYINKIKDNINENQIAKLYDEFNTFLFKQYCSKGYLGSCEPEYCSFRHSDTCNYIIMIHRIKNEYGIDIIWRKTDG